MLSFGNSLNCVFACPFHGQENNWGMNATLNRKKIYTHAIMSLPTYSAHWFLSYVNGENVMCGEVDHSCQKGETEPELVKL